MTSQSAATTEVPQPASTKGQRMRDDTGTGATKDKGGSWRADFAELSPIFSPLATLAAAFRDFDHWPTHADYDRLAQSNGLSLRFVPSAPKGRRKQKKTAAAPMPYEEHVFRRREVPTRAASWHDFFNMLVWNLFPETKAALNERQILGREPGVVRTREQDRLAMFDEGGVVLFGDDPVVFGHAIYENAITGGSSCNALPLAVSACDVPGADRELAAQIRAGLFLTTERFPRYELR
jgi:hypothetical protein